MNKIDGNQDGSASIDFRDVMLAPLCLFLGLGFQVMFTGERSFGSGQLGLWSGVVLVVLYPLFGYGRTSRLNIIGKWTFAKWIAAAVTLICGFYLVRFLLIAALG